MQLPAVTACSNISKGACHQLRSNSKAPAPSIEPDQRTVSCVCTTSAAFWQRQTRSSRGLAECGFAGLHIGQGGALLLPHLAYWTCRAERDLVRLQSLVETKAEAAQDDVAGRHAAFEVIAVQSYKFTCA